MAGQRGKRAGRGPVRGRASPGPDLVELAIVLMLVFCALFLGGRILVGRFSPEPEAPPRPLTMDEARAANAAIPFVEGPVEPARAYRFTGTPAARLQAVECLATVAMYEAGKDARGQKAVIQVVLNRVRAAGFPKTICGVVYQGSGRTTGCQFSFTCDGSVQRRRERTGWGQVRKAARQALSGRVFDEVGTATHYHTDWIVPYWIGSLDKIAKIDTHIFYRPKRSRA